ncbi:MAG: phosphoglycolate phosphatase [Solirubrobacteraceae bacterium]|nr:phosphoglycolate phosphatase [Solirubrobacteraceae bacterium]
MTALLLLFDIDGTLLLRASDAHRDALHAALREVHGIEDPGAAHVAPAGRTDGEIARAIALQCGISATRVDDRAADVRDVTCREYARRVPDDLSRFVAPGIPDLLSELEQRDDVRLGLVTGNYEPVARVKLARAGLGAWFEPGQGGFGSDHEDRAALPGIARRRAGGDGAPWPRERTVVIGDTPNDIACARADAVRVFAVATGPFSADDLRGADAVAANAAELSPLLAAALAP